MAKEPKPEAWIGRRVAVTLNVRNPEEFVGELEEVNDRGVTLVIGPGSSREALTFYPWGSIRRLRLYEESDIRPATGPRKPGQRLAGDPGWFS
ncbi:MAG: hypothetical protein WA990_01310 [Rubrobacteraceae bacterium]